MSSPIKVPSMSSSASLLSLYSLLLLLLSTATATATEVCIVGSGIGGSSLAHFLKHYSDIDDVRIFERLGRVGGRTATVTIGGDTFEAGASILHPRNRHAADFASLLNLSRRSDSDSESDSWFGIWDGSRFVFKTLPPPTSGSSFVYRKTYSLLNSLVLFWRYGFSLLRMNRFVQEMVDRFCLYYSEFESRPVFDNVEEMLKWSGLHALTQRTLEQELTNAGLSSLLISELITVITRINYGQSVGISGLAGAVSIAGSDPGLWSVDGGNWQLAAGLINHSKTTLHLHEEISSIVDAGGYYVLNSVKGNNYSCKVTVIATPLDELNITIDPPVVVPSRKLQHTFTTFVRGLLNLTYFGFSHASDIPVLIGTLETPVVPFRVSLFSRNIVKKIWLIKCSRVHQRMTIRLIYFSAKGQKLYA
ncbi:farnesylcysteine lyase [Iris pallida]|uniref:Farnesylcysteine lyase n=1 Tax=Iris pallida TaxID=29817 RepID=A0AAX6E2S6_IRIPA|nr:farnesylcysteine lyase [Iris pallida]